MPKRHSEHSHRSKQSRQHFEQPKSRQGKVHFGIQVSCEKISFVSVLSRDSRHTSSAVISIIQDHQSFFFSFSRDSCRFIHTQSEKGREIGFTLLRAIKSLDTCHLLEPIFIEKLLNPIENELSFAVTLKLIEFILSNASEIGKQSQRQRDWREK
jgi:hypothetical protein